MKNATLATGLFTALLPVLAADAAGQLTVTAVNPLSIARPSQTLELTREQLLPLGQRDLSRIHIRDASGQDLLCQAVDVDYDAYHTPDIVIFQSDFAPGETKKFTVTSGGHHKLRPQDYKAYGRFVRERFDDFAWENDLIAHRMYGKALETWRGEPLTSSAIDIWSKLTPRLIINEWYMMGDAYYHNMTDNGGDDYTAGATRGDGGNGLWAGDKLWVSRNFVDSRELANGPIRVMFELQYDPFEVDGRSVSEVMRVTLDAGSQMDHYQVVFTPQGGDQPLSAAVGLKKVRDEQTDFNKALGALAVWEPMEKKRGMQGVAVIVPPKQVTLVTGDRDNDLVVVRTGPQHTLDYWAGFDWDRAGRIPSAEAWKTYVHQFAQSVQSPIAVSVSAN